MLASKETEWDVTAEDPQYHYDAILAAMKDTASVLPRIDAIGGSDGTQVKFGQTSEYQYRPEDKVSAANRTWNSQFAMKKRKKKRRRS